MPSLAAQLAQTAVPVFTLLALVLAFRPRHRATAREAALARAQWLTVAAVVVGLYLLAATVLRARSGNPFGLLLFIALCIYATVAWHLVRRAWGLVGSLTRAQAAERARREASSTDEPPPRHRGLSGDEPPPNRW